LRYALDGIMAYTDMPLKLPLWLGGFMSVVGAGGLIAAGIVKLCDDFAVVMGWALAALIVLVGGLILVSLGVMGAYIGKIHTQVKNRPVFITRDVYSYPED
ncbi:MAG: glycosyltransferase, partial [Clostridia bacterium]|nr:glycosyltransferase [Clostridia bacterium]